MENEILKEQLEKFKLYSKYNTLRTLQENVEDIFEQAVSPEQEIYNMLKQAATGTMGTNEDLLKQAFGKFQNLRQLVAVEKLMKEKPFSNYENISGLLRGELESDNTAEFLEIQKMLQPKGIMLNSAPIPKSGQLPYRTITVSRTKATPAVGDEPVTASGTPNQKGVPGKNTPKVTFKPNDNFPIKFMDSGDKVKQIQTAIGLTNKSGQPNISGKFYTSTEQKLANKMKELGLTYDRNKGVDEETFNLILSGPKPSRQMEKPIEVDRKNVNLNVPKKISTQAPTIQAPQTNLPLEQQFQLAKIELQKAKEGLDAAQQTRDRAQIGTARGVQQAARKKVQDLRAQLYPPQQ
jgi:hypothetical protein